MNPRWLLPGAAKVVADSVPLRRYKVAFVMPSKYQSTEDLPKPKNSNVQLREVSSHTLAAISWRSVLALGCQSPYSSSIWWLCSKQQKLNANDLAFLLSQYLIQSPREVIHEKPSGKRGTTHLPKVTIEL